MNYGLIFAGGVGHRMNTKAKPKQFLEIHGKPIIVHTIEYFQKNTEIDYICVVVLDDYIDYMKQLISRFQLSKVKWVVPGGNTSLDSQYNGLKAIKEYSQTDKDIVLIHDGVRPLINTELISRCIADVKEFGSAVTIAPAIETIVQTDGADTIQTTIERSKCFLARAPQCFYLDDILSAHERAIQENNHIFIDSTSLMLHFDYKVHIVEGPAENIKVTNPSDFYICRALLDAREDSQLYGI